MSKLWLEITKDDCPPFEVECDYCAGYGEDVSYMMMTDSRGGQACIKCHGAGTRTARLEGMVEVEINDDESYEVMTFSGFDETFNESNLLYAVKLIINQYHAGTLPDSMMKSKDNPQGLEVVYDD